MTRVYIRPSTRATKRLMAEFPNRVVHFGSHDGSTFSDHGDPEIRDAWIARHSVKGDFKNYESPAALARWLLWEETSLREAIQSLNARQRTWKFRPARKKP